MNEPNDLCRRLRLSEVLLEEYESLDQPHLNPQKLGDIKNQIELSSDTSDHPATQEEEGKIVSSIYRLMAESQKAEAIEECNRKKQEWERKGQSAAERTTIAEISADSMTCAASTKPNKKRSHQCPLSRSKQPLRRKLNKRF